MMKNPKCKFRDWPAKFEAEHGRKLKVLHVGNIASNGYLNAKFLSHAGIDCTVICYDYYHFMSTPEWEEAEICGEWGDDYAPNLGALDLNGYVRPDFFIQGPFELVHKRLSGTDRQRKLAQFKLKLIVRFQHLLFGQSTRSRLLRSVRKFVKFIFNFDKFAKRLWSYIERYIIEVSFVEARVVTLIIRRILRSKRLLPKVNYHDFYFILFSRLRRRKYFLIAQKYDVVSSQLKRFVQLFGEYFPDRPDKLTENDIFLFSPAVEKWREIFDEFDIIQCYSTDPIWPMLAGVKKYVAFEHGTLRTFTMEDNSLHRLVSLAYRQSSCSFITNGDCLDYAKKLNIQNYRAMIHPVDVDLHEQDHTQEVAAIRKALNADVILFCPIRHDWSIKGTEIHIKALPLLKVALGCKRLVIIFTEWGEQVEQSKAMIEKLGCTENVVWERPMPRLKMIRYMKAADATLDQMALPHFGSTAPQSLAAGVPVIMSYKPESTYWIVKEPAPILPAFEPEDVVKQVTKALSQDWLSAFKQKAKAWTHAHHHPSRIIDEHLAVYKNIMEEKNG